MSSDDIDLLFDRLGHPLYDENVTESLWNDKCDYLNIVQILI